VRGKRIIEVSGLTTVFRTANGEARAVDGVDFHVDQGETLAIVGESGSGKSVTALSILRIVPNPPGRIVAGEVRLDGTDLLRLDETAMRAVRGNDIAMIFQEPMTSLNPVFTIGDQIVEAIRTHHETTHRAARDRAVEMLATVGIPDPEKRVHDYPHRLSGGMRQRVMIAMAIACQPRLLIADEPTTALDVTIQAQILAILLDLRRRLDMGMILITHDLGVVAETADRVVVMYAGRIVEEGRVADIFGNPQHPYTQGLIEATPHGATLEAGRARRLREIPGVVPPLFDMPPGCAFAPRCSRAIPRCEAERPELMPAGRDCRAACFLPGPPTPTTIEDGDGTASIGS